MIDTYTVGVVVSRSGLTDYQTESLRAMLKDWRKAVKHLVCLVPGFSNSSKADLPPGILALLRASLEWEGFEYKVGGFRSGPETQAVLGFLDGCDELVGFPARGRMPYKPDRVWSLYRAWQERPHPMKIVRPWVSTNSCEVKAGKKE